MKGEMLATVTELRLLVPGAVGSGAGSAFPAVRGPRPLAGCAGERVPGSSRRQGSSPGGDLFGLMHVRRRAALRGLSAREAMRPWSGCLGCISGQEGTAWWSPFLSSSSCSDVHLRFRLRVFPCSMTPWGDPMASITREKRGHY